MEGLNDDDEAEEDDEDKDEEDKDEEDEVCADPAEGPASSFIRWDKVK